MTFGGYTVAYLYATNTRSNLYGYTHKLVTHDIWWSTVALRPLIPFIHM
jgi:hypothetical protein